MTSRSSLVRLGLAVACAAAARAQDAPLFVSGGTVHARPEATPVVAHVLVVDGKIKAVGKDVVAPDGAVVVDATGLDVYPSLIDPCNDALLETYPAGAGSLGGGDRALDLLDRFAAPRRADLFRAGVGVVGLAAPVGGMRSGVGAALAVALDGEGAPLVLAPDRFVQFDVAAPQRGGGGGGPFGDVASATLVALPPRMAALRGLEDALEGAKKYKEAWEKYAKDLEEYEKKKGGDGKATDSKPSEEPKPERRDEGAAPTGPPEGFRDWPREKQREWMRENLRRGRPGAGSGGPAPESRPSGGDKLKPPEKPKVEPEKEALVRVLKREVPLWIGVAWEQDIAAALDLCAKREVKPALIGAAEAPRLIERLKAARALVVLPPPVAYDEEPTGGVPEDLSARLAEAGIPFTFFTAGASEYGPGGVRFAAALAMGRGLTERQALQATTLDAAKALGLEKSLGSIEAGKEAHLLLVRGSPFAPDGRVVKVVTRNRVVFAEP